MENVVFLELSKRKGVLDEIYYWRKNHDVDFVVLKKQSLVHV
jgi:predicted AAA+ superfamily ATPase